MGKSTADTKDLGRSLLSGLKVLDFTTLLPGPLATLMLADLGADVVRIESPTRPDLARLAPPYVEDDGPISCLHAYLNRNKRSLSLDLKKTESVSLIERMIKAYDIVVEQFRPGVMERLGLSFERLCAINPGLIYCSLTGYGQSGPLKDKAGHDVNYLALSGLMSYSGRKDTGPALLGTQLADIGSGTNNTVIGILAAVIHRHATGLGQHIDISMTDGLFPFHAAAAIKELCGDAPSTYENEVLNGGSLYGFYETADGRYISFGGLEHQFFTVFCTAIGLEDLIAGSVLQPGRVEEAKRQVAEVIRTKPLAHWVALFKEKDACFEPVLTFAEAVRSEHAAARELLVKVPGLNGKSYEQLACPIKFSGYAPVYKRIGCRIGQDTLAVLTEIGLRVDEIGELKDKGVFGAIEIV